MGSAESMEQQPFEKMKQQGVPKADHPTEVAAPKKEEQDVPVKMSAQEFRVYNRMAEHMDMFVCPLLLPQDIKRTSGSGKTRARIRYETWLITC